MIMEPVDQTGMLVSQIGVVSSQGSEIVYSFLFLSPLWSHKWSQLMAQVEHSIAASPDHSKKFNY